MASLPLIRRPHEPQLRLSRRDLVRLRHWLKLSAGAELVTAAPGGAASLVIASEQTDVATERRGACRDAFRAAAEVRPIGAGSIGPIRSAAVQDVSPEGLALLLASPLEAGQAISVEVHPPPALPKRRWRRSERPIQLLATVRYCRPHPAGHLLGCSIGVGWTDSLANQMFPPALRRSA